MNEWAAYGRPYVYNHRNYKNGTYYMDFYLITGFLGAGKTTFLKNFIKSFSKQKVYLVVNEFGREGVDGTLLKELNAMMSEINNGSIFCACRLDKFEEELDKIISAQPDVVITEASGLSDPTNIKKVLSGYPSITYKGSICIADAAGFRRVVTTARVCPKQLSVSSLILINKTDLADEESIRETERQIRALSPFSHIRRTLRGGFQDEWLSLVTPEIDVSGDDNRKDLTLQKRDIKISPNMTEDQFFSLLRLLCEDTYRVKGFAEIGGKIYFADCTGPTVKAEVWSGSPPENTGHITALSGEGMNLRHIIKTMKEMYSGLVDVTAD